MNINRRHPAIKGRARLYLNFPEKVPGGTRCGAPRPATITSAGKEHAVQERKRLYFLLFLVAVVALLVCASTVDTLYQAALAQQKQQLAEMVKSQARLMEAVARHHRKEQHGRSAAGADAETLNQIRDAFAHYPGFSQTGAFMLARREGDRIVFLSSQRNETRRHPQFVTFAGTQAEPMRRALNGQSGAIVTTDYRDVAVISAYEPVHDLGLGLVAKIDLEEVRAPYVHAGVIAGLLAVAAVVLGGALVFRTADPLLRRLRVSEERYRMLMEDAADAIFIADARGNYLSANARAGELLGYSREELLRLNIRDVIPDGDPPSRHAELRDDSPLLTERRLRRKDGCLVHAEIHAKALPDGRLQAIVRDITARKRAEAALHESEAQYRAVIETSADGFWIVDMEGRLREVNDAYVRRSGYTREELLAMRVPDVEAREKPEETAAHIARIVREGCDLFESWHRAKDGSLWPVEINAAHWPEAGGLFFVFVRDISARRAAETQTQKLSRALAQTADAVMVTDRTGVIEYVNPAIETMTGYARDELIGRKPDVFRSGVQDAPFYRRLWNTVLAGESFSDVLVNRRKDGSLYYEEKLISPIKDGDGNITHFVATARDITERMAVQEQLQHLAHHDALTGLPNRMLFTDRLQQALDRARRRGRTFAIMFLDLDDFKRINDAHGHETGDRVLRGVAARLRTAVRVSDTVARFGGDEFAFVVDDLAQAADLAIVAAKIRQAFAEPIALAEGEFPVGASIGVSLYPDDGDDADALLRCADAAMYSAKGLGEGGVRFHPPL